MSTYQEFLQSKRAVVEPAGFEVISDDINRALFPFQRDIVRVALHLGRYAFFEECGLAAFLAHLCYNSRKLSETAGVLPARAAASDHYSHGRTAMATPDSTSPSPRNKKQPFTCLNCGKVFWRYASSMSNPERPFCSLKCVGEAKKNSATLYCEWCDSPFYRRASEHDATRHFCSRKCYMDWRAHNRKPDTYPKSGARHVHRIVAEQYLGRPLLPQEVVHHIDLNKHNNAPDNLAVLPNQEFHVRVHAGEVSDAELRRFSLQ